MSTTSIRMHISNINAFLLHISYNVEFPANCFKTNWDYKHQTIDDRQDTNTAGWIEQQIECNIPDPLTSEEDATIALTIWATAPWTCMYLRCWNKMLWTRTRTCIHDYLSYNGSKHTFIQAFSMFIIIINSKYDCRSKIDRVTYLIKNSFRN